MKITHVYFADDLLVLCHGDAKSVKVVRDSIYEFGECSGLLPNFNKSTIFFGIVKDEVQKEIMKVLPFKKGKLPMKYLGRLQLIASILESIQVYWCTVFLLPKAVLKEINNLLMGFLWCNGKLSRGKAKIAWKKICKPITHGGLGLKDLELWNKALLVKHIWNIACQHYNLTNLLKSWLSQLLTEFGMLACKPYGIPIESKEGVVKPSKGKVSHLKLAFRVLRYLKTAPGKGISFSKGTDLDLNVYVDSDWAKCKSKKQSMLSKSFAKAEYRAMNNVTSIQIAANPVFHERTKHFEIELFFLREKVADGVVKNVKIKLADNIADIFTKGLSVVDHNIFCENLGVLSEHMES
ncbi:hypothetical protein Tco_0252566 [Tanacetum coccineum]